MSLIQRMMTAVVPKSWAESMEAESRTWMVRCACGHERSIWDLGGVRWKATGSPRRYLKCPHCEKASWHEVTRGEPRA